MNSRWRLSRRRGATTVVFAVTAMSVLGMIALAGEAGTWYLARSRAQDVADAAAIAATLEYVATGNTDTVSTAGQYVAAQNGYSTGVTVQSGPANCYVAGSGCTVGSTSQFEAVATVRLTSYLSALFTNLTPLVEAHSVAGLRNIGYECALSLTGNFSLQANQSASRCIYGSNSTSASAVSISSGLTVTLNSITTVGDCSNSGCASATLTRPYTSYQPPTVDPYTITPPFTLPACGSISVSGTNITMQPGLYSESGTACAIPSSYLSGSTFNLGASGQTWTLNSGFYYFSNVSVAIANGTIRCVISGIGCTNANSGGITMILTGSPASSIGNLYICQMSGGNCSGATLATFSNIVPQKVASVTSQTAGSQSVAGILFYRDSRGVAGSPSVRVWWSSTTTPFNGMLYFPSSTVYYGNSALAASCAVLVAATITIMNVTTRFPDPNNCPSYGVTPPRSRAARLLE